ncbi:MAG: cyclic lactone autoinducer peptide [Ruthenibacterium sp.]
MKKHISVQILKWFTSASCFMAILSVNTACVSILHKPKIPAALNKYKNNVQ